MPIDRKYLTIKGIRQYFLDRVKDLHALSERGDPWVFICASAYINYLVNLVNGKETTGQDYKDFLTDYFFKACPKYQTFVFDNGQSDMHIQMYHVLRCGILHRFSLRADVKGRIRGGRDRSILLAHRGEPNVYHLKKYVNRRMRPKLDSAILVAQDFVDDLEAVTKYIFKQANKKTSDAVTLRANIIKWVKQCPPLGTDQVSIA